MTLKPQEFIYTDPQRVFFPPWFAPFFPAAQWKTAFGGRSSSKTYTVAQWLVLRAAESYVRCVCARQFQKSIDHSVLPTLAMWIHRLGLTRHFKIHKYHIACPSTGSEFFFSGLERNIESTRGWHDVTDAWFEEAQMLPGEFDEVVVPTLTRGEHLTQMWFTWNPRLRTDFVWNRFVANPEPGDVIARISYRDNPWHNLQAEKQRLRHQKNMPHLYSHIWEGMPNDGDGDTTVLPYHLLEACVRAYKEGLHRGATKFPAHAGLDIADGGADRNAWVGRRGPCIEHVKAWHSDRPGYLMPTARRADDLMREYDLSRIYYDTGGVGAPIRESFHRLDEEREYAYSARPVAFGGAVGGPKRQYSYRRTNEEAFARRNAQLAFAVRLRALRTVKLMEGDDVDPDKCLFINPNIPGLEQYLAQLTQPQWYDNPINEKITIDKRGELEGDSPDEYDATVLAFARDSEEGLSS